MRGRAYAEIDDPLYMEYRCPECGEMSRVHIEDGSFDFEHGSINGVQHAYRLVTDCCEAEVEA
jgi:phage FluMu protein Com